MVRVVCYSCRLAVVIFSTGIIDYDGLARLAMDDRPTSHRVGTPSIPIRSLLYEIRFFRFHPLFENYTRGTQRDGCESWVSLGGNYERPPNHYTVSLLERNGPPLICDPVEELRHPPLYSPTLEFLGYVPDAAAWYIENLEDDIPWPFKYYVDLEGLVEDNEGKGQLPDRRIQEIANDLKAAREIVCMLEERGGLPLTMVDNGYRAGWLKACKGEYPCRCGLYQARSCFLRLLGAISWSLYHVDSHTKTSISRLKYTEFRRWLLFDAVPKLGFILDPRADGLEATPLLDMRRNNCPIYYPWSHRWRFDPSNAELESLAVLNPQNFLEVVEKACLTRPKLQDYVRTGPPTFLGPIITPRFTQDDGVVPTGIQQLQGRESSLSRLQEKAEEALGSDFTHVRPSYVVWTFGHEQNLPKDAIVIISVTDEARLRLWALRTRCSNPSQVVFEAVARGMSIRLVYGLCSETARKAILQADLHEPDSPPTPTGYLRGTSTDYWKTWEEYLGIAGRLLSRTNAVAYVMHGGLIARIAFWLGPTDLLSRFAQGPSVSARLRPIYPQSTENFLLDFVEPRDIFSLYGIVQDPIDGTLRSWFPTGETMENCGFWKGEWTMVHEQWLITRIRCIRERTANARPLTADQWLDHLERVRISNMANISMPDGDVMQSLVDEFSAETGGNWNGANLQEINDRFGYVGESGNLLRQNSAV